MSLFADLATQGCVADGSQSLNNPLSRLGKGILDAARQRDLGGSSDMHAAMPAGPGPSSSSGLLPEMGPSEAAFMHAFEHNTLLQREWEAAAPSAKK